MRSNWICLERKGIKKNDSKTESLFVNLKKQTIFCGTNRVNKQYNNLFMFSASV